MVKSNRNSKLLVEYFSKKVPCYEDIKSISSDYFKGTHRLKNLTGNPFMLSSCLEKYHREH